ncbi:MAG: DUF2061 domain-containing protein [Pseudomonadota bacterium]
MLKAVSWRIVATTTTIVISYFITGSAKYALSIGMIEVVAKIILYYMHERLWQALKLIRRKNYAD